MRHSDRRGIFQTASVIFRVLRREAEDAVRLAECLNEIEQQQVLIAAGSTEPEVRIASLVFVAQQREVGRIAACGDGGLHRRLIDAKPLPNVYDPEFRPIGPRRALPCLAIEDD